MAFMEMLSAKSKNVTQKAKDMTEQTKIKNLIKSEQDKIESLYAAIGKLYYENESEPLKEPYADIVKTIKIAMSKIEDYRNKSEDLKTKYVCPNCGASVTASTQFCKECGTKITNFH